MSEEEFLEQIEEYEERNHGLTLMLDRVCKLLWKYGKKSGVEVDLELWEEVAKPSLNVGLWYYQLVEGHNIMLSYPKLSLGIGLVAVAVIGLSALSQIKAKKKAKKEEAKEVAEKNIEGKKVNEEKNEVVEEQKERVNELVSSDLLDRINKNLSS